ncbi:MAG: hypothetical protein LBE27_07175 [Deltaproteobacteria bacterium]|jgi:hypothetical protein|nr:hypothetical protein [Deltaproteobacteria bacterium]
MPEPSSNPLRKSYISLFILLGIFLLPACAVKPIHRETQPIEQNISPVRSVIEHGDWVVIRGVTGPDNLIGAATNMPFSHASIYDAENDQVIEADSHGVHLTSLEEYLGSASRVWIIKPMWATPETRPLAVERARALLGRPYDFTGVIGLGLPDRYYCSELVMAVWKPFRAKNPMQNPIPLVISPGRLHHWGRVVYDSMEIGFGVVPEPKKP